MTQRNSGAYMLGYDTENRLTSVSGGATASFAYDGDGNRVKGTVNGVTTVYVGNYYELSDSTTRTYYYAGSTRVAVKENDPYLNRWLQPDSIVPQLGDPQSLNRYSYVNNNPSC